MLPLSALAKVIEFIWLVETQEDGGLRRDGARPYLYPQQVDSYVPSTDGVARLSESVVGRGGASAASLTNQRQMMGDPERNQALCELVCDEVEKLPPRLRDVVEAYVFQGLGTRRIARLDWIDRQHVTVHTNLRVGLRILRSRLEDHPLIKEWLNA